MSHRILITGSRAWSDRAAIRAALLDAVVLHGPLLALRLADLQTLS